MIKQKKALATGLTWMVAALVLLLFGLIFLAGVFFLSKGDIIFGQESSAIEIPRDASSSQVLETNFNALLNKKVQFGTGQITLVDLAERSTIAEGFASDLFKKSAKETLEELYPYPINGWSGFSEAYAPAASENRRVTAVHPYWLAVFNADEIITKDHSQNFAVGGFDCAPFSSESITLTRYTESKKITLCINKEYHKVLEGNK